MLPEQAAELAAGAEARRADLIDALREISALDAPSGDRASLGKVADLLEPRLRGLGARVTREETAVGPLLQAELGPPRTVAREGSLILCHYDTVWPLGTVARRPLRIEDGVAHGPGAFDMRGGMLAMLAALELLDRLGALGRPTRILLTPDEETGSRASVDRIQECAQEAAVVLVPEPPLPDGGMKTARSGWLSLVARARGRAAHAGLEPERGVSAIDAVVDAVTAMRTLADADRGVLVNCGVIAGGTAVNVVAAEAEAEIDIRFPDLATGERLAEELAGLRPADPRATLAMEARHSRPPLERTEAVVAAAMRARELAEPFGLRLTEGRAGGVSDANLAAVASAAVLDGIGPQGGGAHAVDEHVDLSSLVQRIGWYGALIAWL